MLTFKIENETLILFYNNEQIFKFFKNEKKEIYSTYKNLDNLVNRVDMPYADEYEYKTTKKLYFKIKREEIKCSINSSTIIHTMVTETYPDHSEKCEYEEILDFIYKLHGYTSTSKNKKFEINNILISIYEFLLTNQNLELLKMIEDPIYAEAKKLILENTNNNKKLLKMISELSTDYSKEKLKEVSEKIIEINKILE